MTKKILKVMAVLAFIYVGYFGLWAMMQISCQEKYGADQCGGDEMSKIAKVGYGWLIK